MEKELEYDSPLTSYNRDSVLRFLPHINCRKLAGYLLNKPSSFVILMLFHFSKTTSHRSKCPFGFPPVQGLSSIPLNWWIFLMVLENLVAFLYYFQTLSCC